MKKQGPIPKPRILTVDDDRDFQTVLETWLSPAYDVVALPNGEGVLEEIQETRPDLAILDVRLPGPDGFTLCRAIRRLPRFNDIPILFLTACAGDEDFARNLEAGGTAYLTKPLDRKELLKKVKELLGQTIFL